MQGRTGGADYAKLKYWGLLIPKELKRTGWWQPTLRGCMFAKNSISLPKYAYIYNDTVLGFSRERQTIHDALDSKFNYDELLGGPPVKVEA